MPDITRRRLGRSELLVHPLCLGGNPFGWTTDRDGSFAVLDAYVPAIVLLFIAGAALTWVLDRVIAGTGLYRVVWHPSLFRASLLVCVCGVLGLAVYR